MFTLIQRSLRFLLYNILGWILVIFFTFLLLLAWPFGHRQAYFFAHTWARCCMVLVKRICGLSLRIEGFENIPKESCVFFFKHSSAFETFAALATFPRSCWVIKRELVWIPFFGWTHIALDSIAINRSKGSTAVSQVITEGKDRLEQGLNIIIYPEGTRMPIGTTKRYGISGTLLAQESGAPIVPVAHDAGRLWPRRGWAITPGEIVMRIGKPVDASDRDAREVNEEIQTWVENEVADIVGTEKVDEQRAA